MTYLSAAAKKLQQQINNIDELVSEEVLSREADITQEVRDRWRKGEKPDGSAIGMYRNKQYAAEKHAQNPEAGFGFVDLIHTHGLEKGLKISPYGSGFEVYSRDPKYNQIAERFGDENFNITDAQADDLKEEVKGAVLQKILSKTYK